MVASLPSGSDDITEEVFQRNFMDEELGDVERNGRVLFWRHFHVYIGQNSSELREGCLILILVSPAKFQLLHEIAPLSLSLFAHDCLLSRPFFSYEMDDVLLAAHGGSFLLVPPPLPPPPPTPPLQSPFCCPSPLFAPFVGVPSPPLSPARDGSPLPFDTDNAGSFNLSLIHKHPDDVMKLGGASGSPSDETSLSSDEDDDYGVDQRAIMECFIGFLDAFLDNDDNPPGVPSVASVSSVASDDGSTDFVTEDLAKQLL